jgi:hypothetical protein
LDQHQHWINIGSTSIGSTSTSILTLDQPQHQLDQHQHQLDQHQHQLDQHQHQHQHMDQPQHCNHSREEEEKEERKFSSPVTESARKANNNMINIDSLRKEAKKFTFKNEKLKLAFGRRVPDKISKQVVSPTKKKKIKEQRMRDVVHFQIVMNADEFRLYVNSVFVVYTCWWYSWCNGVLIEVYKYMLV